MFVTNAVANRSPELAIAAFWGAGAGAAPAAVRDAERNNHPKFGFEFE